MTRISAGRAVVCVVCVLPAGTTVHAAFTCGSVWSGV